MNKSIPATLSGCLANMSQRNQNPFVEFNSLSPELVNKFFQRYGTNPSSEELELAGAVNEAIYQEKLKATTDELTGAFNRGGFYRAIDTSLNTTVRDLNLGQEPNYGIVMIDVNGLKGVNDGEGHAAGNEALKRTVGFLRKSVKRDSDLIGRLGGDEFAIFLPDPDGYLATFANEINDEAPKHIFTSDNGVPKTHLSLSIGYGLASEMPEFALEERVAIVDNASYAAKQVFKESGELSDLKANSINDALEHFGYTDLTQLRDRA